MTMLLINPETKVGVLLDRYPEVEEVLIGLAPEFRRLTNPLLRRTVARVATLAQAAGVAGIPVRTLVAELRRAVGQPVEEVKEDGSAAAETAPRPEWAADERVAVRIGAEEVMASGRTPVAVVSERMTEVPGGSCLVLSAPFFPAPLVDALTAKGHAVWSRPLGTGAWEVWISSV